MSVQELRRRNRKRRAHRALLHTGLGVVAAALAAGIFYASVCLWEGRSALDAALALLPVRTAAPAALPEPAAQPAPAPEPAAQPAPQNAAPVWNIEGGAPRQGVTGDDARMLAVPENGCVSDDYFRDALFIGDSVMQGFGWYPQYRDWMRVCAYKGVNPQQILQNVTGTRPDGTPIEMWDDINVQQDVANIYIMMGANALVSQPVEGYLKYFGDLLDRLRERFAGVPIYVQSLTPTTYERGQKQPGIARDRLIEVNNALAKMAVEKGLYYVDLWEALSDADGYLRADLSGDGLHLLDGSKYRPWLDYLARHTVYSAHNAQFALTDQGPYN